MLYKIDHWTFHLHNNRSPDFCARTFGQRSADRPPQGRPVRGLLREEPTVRHSYGWPPENVPYKLLAVREHPDVYGGKLPSVAWGVPLRDLFPISRKGYVILTERNRQAFDKNDLAYYSELDCDQCDKMGDLLDFGKLFKAFGNNYFSQISHILR